MHRIINFIKKKSFTLNIDSKPTKIKPNKKIFLQPGQSITIKPYFCHYLKSSNKNKNNLIVGEVSSLNDDCCDNYFPDKNLRFSKIEEDEEIISLFGGNYHCYFNK